MQEGKENRWVKLDPRTELLLLILANVIAFTSYTPIVELTLIGLLVLLLAICGCGKTALKWIVLFACLLGIQYFLIPFLPKVLAVMFIILTVYARKIFPCLIVGTLMLKTTPVRFFVIALRKWHLPQWIIIPLSITIRYFPAIQEERRHIKDAVKLRKIKGLKERLESKMVPLLMSATTTADELSAAAITRGIENPVAKTCIVDLRFHIQDYICLTIAVLFIGIVNFVL